MMVKFVFSALKQQKVLKVAFVESINMAERRQKAYQELKEKEMAAKHMPADPKQLAITSLTAAILNRYIRRMHYQITKTIHQSISIIAIKSIIVISMTVES